MVARRVASPATLVTEIENGTEGSMLRLVEREDYTSGGLILLDLPPPRSKVKSLYQYRFNPKSTYLCVEVHYEEKGKFEYTGLSITITALRKYSKFTVTDSRDQAEQSSKSGRRSEEFIAKFKLVNGGQRAHIVEAGLVGTVIMKVVTGFSYLAGGLVHLGGFLWNYFNRAPSQTEP